MAADYNVQLLLGVMECTNGGRCRRVFLPPEILPFHAALVLSALTWLLVLHLSSVSVLMLIMPPIKIYIKSYNATRSHASDQSPGKAETIVKKDTKSLTWFYFTLNNSMISKFTKFLFCVPWDRIKIYSWFSWETLPQSNTWTAGPSVINLTPQLIRWTPFWGQHLHCMFICQFVTHVHVLLFEHIRGIIKHQEQLKLGMSLKKE